MSLDASRGSGPSASDIAVLHGTIASLFPHAKELVAHFYGRLFGRCPELEQLFESHSLQQQHAKLWAVLGVMATTETETEQYAERFVLLRAEHAPRGLTTEHYRIFGELLLESLRYFSGHRWTEEAETAWSAAIREAAARVSGARDAESDAA